ncbi:hypothetical protein FIV42_05570 [Persicimonas caeni]|uniref:Uncharacterized protein n=1 Tax=Persicimonas caeni TaxID=2292766 RepID=A0A4Y6PR00_PERCE|nr:hypothetical protein [Persicimonas caeni]QDG50215.1 hypothetical protein FIV42_05570 [Persicimonas caeni]QED31436.1 hypothetical protein FRD00_05565 [Persicimonas caeni]
MANLKQLTPSKPAVRIFLLTLLLAVFAGLGAVGCGDTDDGGSDGASTDSNNDNTNNDNTNNSSSDATCSQACSNAVGVCSQIGTQSDCEAACSQLSQSELNCMSTASSCAAINACGDGGGGGNNNSNGNDGEIGSTCAIDEECNSNYCRRTGEAIEGQCAQNDFGDSCDGADACLYGRCMVYSQDDVTGFCSADCTTENECPFGWSCVESNNGSSKYCQGER